MSGLRDLAREHGSGQFSRVGSLLGFLFIRVPYYIGDLTRGPNLENYPYKRRGA